MNRILIILLITTSLFGAKYLAILDLEPTGITQTEAKVLTQTLTSKMIELSDYTIVERANIDKILKEQKFQHSGCTDRECAVEIGQLLNADITIIGTAGKIGSTYTLQTRIINVATGEALTSADFTHKGEIDELLREGIESVVHEMLGIPYQKKINFKSSSSDYGYNQEINSNPSVAVTDINVLESRLKKIVTLIPGNVNQSWPSEGVDMALWAMQDNKQLSTKKFINIIGSGAQLEYLNWQRKNNNLMLILNGTTTISVGMLILTFDKQVATTTLFWGFASIYSFMKQIKTIVEIRTMKSYKNLLDWTDQNHVEIWVNDYNNKINKTSETSHP